MRGIQVMYVSPSNAAQDGDDLVRDLENWFEDHRQMCRLMVTAVPTDLRELASSMERLSASVDSGQRLLGRLKTNAQSESPRLGGAQPSGGRIPLSGMNRFNDTRGTSPVAQTQASPVRPSVSSASAASTQIPTSFTAVTNLSAPEIPRVLPSRTYLKKNTRTSG